MRRYLVVANQTLGGDELVQTVRECMLRGPAKFWVLVPATHVHHVRVGYGEVADADRTANAGATHAQQQLDTELARLREAGADAEGEVGDENPMTAITHTLARQEFDEIILSTLPQGRSNWLRQDLVSQIQKKFSVPVTHVVTEARHA
jgi:hypothetical protein